MTESRAGSHDKAKKWENPSIFLTTACRNFMEKLRCLLAWNG